MDCASPRRLFISCSLQLTGYDLCRPTASSTAKPIVAAFASGRIVSITLRIVGVCFLALALYVGYEAIESLLRSEAPERSLAGIILAAVSVVVMPILARAKRRVTAGIRSGAMEADARQTDFCVYLSAILLGGLLANALFGWWWADPVAALVMTPIIARESVEALRGKACCDDGCH
jgi:divalent metal cation (Fe/Co/Zn/Cd) transporter